MSEINDRLADILIAAAKKLSQGNPARALIMLLRAAQQHAAAAPDDMAKDVDAAFMAAFDGMVAQREHYRTCPVCKDGREHGISLDDDTDNGPVDPRKLN